MGCQQNWSCTFYRHIIAVSKISLATLYSVFHNYIHPFFRYGNNAWGDWHGSSTSGNLQSFELAVGSVIVAVRGTKHSLPTNYLNEDGQPIDSIEGITFISSDGTNYGPYGGSGGTDWDETLEEGTSVLFISGYADTVLEGIGFHHST